MLSELPKGFMMGKRNAHAQAAWNRKGGPHTGNRRPDVEDVVEHPSHYNQNNIEVIDVIETYAATSPHLANVLKYVCRHSYKGKPLEDLQKARWYLDRKIKLMEAGMEHEDEVADTYVVPGVGDRVGGTNEAHKEMQHAYYKWDATKVSTYCVQCDAAIYNGTTYVTYNDGVNDLPFCSNGCQSNYFDEMK